MGVGLRPNCPDRSWCVAALPGMRSSGDTGRAASRDRLWDKHLHHGGERNYWEEDSVTRQRSQTVAVIG